jgi:hypothetical protein
MPNRRKKNGERHPEEMVDAISAAVQEWGDYQASCTSAILYPYRDCVCKHSLIFVGQRNVGLFKSELLFSSCYVATSVDLWKKCKSLKGVAGRKRHAFMKELACD